MKASKLPSGTWRVRVYAGTKDGKKVYKSFTGKTKKEAECKAAIWNVNAKIEGEDLTIRCAVERYIEEREPVLSPSTIAGYKSALKNEFCGDFGAMAIKHLNSAEAQKFVNSMVAKGVSPKTIANRYTILTAAVAQVAPDKTLRVKLPTKQIKRVLAPDTEDVRLIMEVAKKTDIEVYRAILLSALGTMRRGEICALTADDIDRKRNVITVSKAMTITPNNTYVIKTPKTVDSNREIPYPKAVIDIMPKEGRIVSITPNQLTNRFGRMLRRNLLPEIRFHDLRHYAATMMAVMGIPKAVACDIGGWRSSSGVMERVYVNVQNEERKKGEREMVKFASTFFEV